MNLRCLLLGHAYTGHRVHLSTLRAWRTCARCGHIDTWAVPADARSAPMSEELRRWLERRASEQPAADPALEKEKR